MRSVLRLVMMVALLSWAQPATADTPGLPAQDQAAVEAVIRQQMAAFQRNDAPGAFAFAAPGIQRKFGDARTFLETVRHVYQPVYAPRSVDFTRTSQEDGAVMQYVELIGPDGLAYTALYTMEREADGSWRIAGCELLESKRFGS